MNFEVFNDGVYVVESSVPLYRGDEVFVTSATDFEYDSAYGCFNSTQFTYEVELTIVNEDLSEYNPAKSRNGGCYAFAKGIATSVRLLD